MGLPGLGKEQESRLRDVVVANFHLPVYVWWAHTCKIHYNPIKFCQKLGKHVHFFVCLFLTVKK